MTSRPYSLSTSALHTVQTGYLVIMTERRLSPLASFSMLRKRLRAGAPWRTWAVAGSLGLLVYFALNYFFNCLDSKVHEPALRAAEQSALMLAISAVGVAVFLLYRRRRSARS